VPLVTFYFQLHQPLRLNPEGTEFLWEQANREVFSKVAQRCYLPAIRMFVRLIRDVPALKICLSLSGTFLDQARRFRPEVLDLLHELYQTGLANRQVEFLDETYYHSLTALFSDPAKTEFKEQVSLHRQKMAEVFGVQPVAFRNTELIYNNEIASLVAEMGYPVMLCEQRADMFTAKEGRTVSPHAVFRAKGIQDRPGAKP
jgi:alpha-amylase